MYDMIDFSIPLAGLERATSSLNQTAAKIAKTGPSDGDTVDLSAEMVELLKARRNFHANANVVRTEAEVEKTVLNILG